jgi:hypothetical protein
MMVSAAMWTVVGLLRKEECGDTLTVEEIDVRVGRRPTFD